MKILQMFGRGGTGSATFAATGVLAAFGAGACCALPLVLAGAGLGTAWLSQVALITAPYRSALLLIATVALAAGAFLLLRQQQKARACADQSMCARPATRLTTLIGLAAGFALLAVALIYG